jgi:ADP-ribose pyrophosphatase
VREYNIKRGGRKAKYIVVERPDSATVIPMTPTETTVLVKHFRFPTRESSWEFPMGAVEPGENPSAAARRELAEEVGLRATALLEICHYRAAPGLTPQNVSVFIARVAEKNLDSGAVFRSRGEEIQDVRTVSLRDLARMTEKNQITDGFTLAALPFLHSWMDRP